MGSTIRFVIVSHEVVWFSSTAYIEVYTDILCHLYCRYTSNPMRVHNAVKNLRGTLRLAEPDYCFTAANQIEQDEPGDSWVHSFTLNDFPEGQQRWWIFLGTVDGVESPSQSPVFNYKYKDSPVYSIGIYGRPEVLVGSVALEAGEALNLGYLEPPEVGINIGY